MTLKQQLEAVWNSKEIASPSRFVKWSTEQTKSYTRTYLEGLYYVRRPLHAICKKKSK